MDISVGAMADFNPEINVGNLLQMIKASGGDKLAAETKKADGTGNETENGNGFLQVLQQNLAALLQSERPGDDSRLTDEKELSIALEKLLREDKTVTGEILSGLALLTMIGKTESPRDGETESFEESLAGLVARTGMNGMSTQEMSAHPEQTNPETVKNEKKIFVSKSILLPEEQKTAQPNGLSEWSTQDKTIEVSLHSNLASLQDRETNTQTVDADSEKRAIAEDKSQATPFQIGEGDDQSVPVKIAEGISLAEKASGDHHDVKASAGVAGGVPENKIHMNLSNKTKINEENQAAPSGPDQAVPDVKQKNSAGPEAVPADQQASPSFRDTQKNIAGKVAATMPESAGVIDKVKPEFKDKTFPVEKNIESNSLNSAALSGVGSTKTAAGDVSPAQIINRVAAAFNETLTSEGGRVKITLAPPALGTLEMDVTVHHSKVRVLLTAENQDVQKMLSGNLESLKGSLQNQGLTIERCDVLMQERREQYSQNFSHQQAFHQEQPAEQRHNEGEGYGRPDAQTVIPLKITPPHQDIWRSGSISLFA